MEDDVSFEDRMSELTMTLGEQMREGRLLDEEIRRQLLKAVFWLGTKLII
jgi:type I restriction enzyme M protein